MRRSRKNVKFKTSDRSLSNKIFKSPIAVRNVRMR